MTIRQRLNRAIRLALDKRGLFIYGLDLTGTFLPWHAKSFGADAEMARFQSAFAANLKECAWSPHPQYSVFTQYDQDHYLARQSLFLQKYKSFYAVSKTIAPRRIIELGTNAGSGADAYLSAAPGAEYKGFDVFGENTHQTTGQSWKPQEVAEALFAERGFRNYELLKVDLRSLERLPYAADFVVVDAAHDFENELADLRLALTANPSYIFVDDADDAAQARPAIEKFLGEDLKDRIRFYCGIPYLGGGLVIRMK